MADAKVTILEKNFVTPVGRARYAKLFRPDTKFVAEGVYETDLILEGEAATKLVNQLEGFADQYAAEIKKKSLKSLPYTLLEDEDGKETGEVKIKAKLKAEGKYGPRRPAVLDSRGTPITAPVEIGNGTTMRLKVKVKGYNTGANNGLTLELVAAQIIELVEYGGGASMEAYEGGGYVAGGQGGSDSDEETDADY